MPNLEHQNLKAGANVIAVVQARMGSKRLPGKTLMKLGSQSILEHHLDTVLQVLKSEQVWIATTVEAEDEVLAAYGQSRGMRTIRGDSENVASRFLQIAKQTSAEFMLRLNADSPLMDPGLIVQVLNGCDDPETDLITTALNRSVPSGMNVEAINTETFRQSYTHFCRAEHFEHVTRFFYENQNQYNIREITSGLNEDEKNAKFSVDSEHDLNLLRKFFNRLEKPHYQYSISEKIRIYQALAL
jgi:spore coat polysaccharide biosynthesis protein SpsF